MLRLLTDAVWVAEAPLRFLGIHLGTRMTAIRLRDGSIVVHSPISLTPTLKAEIDALGVVRHIVAPSLYHHLYAGEWAAAYPEAKMHAAPGLRKKRKDLRIDSELSEIQDPAWSDELVPIPIKGCMLGETVFVHRPSNTAVSSDLTENFKTSEHALTRAYLKIGGIHGKVGLSRLLRPMFRDHRAVRASIDWLLEERFDRLVIAHGDVIEKDAKPAIEETYRFLRP